MRPPGYFEEHRIELRTAARAVRIDRAARKLILGTGEELDYDHLALATGARNRRLAVEGADLAGVLQLRDLAEAIAIRGLLSALREVVVIGAGFIGLEFAATDELRLGNAGLAAHGVEQAVGGVDAVEILRHFAAKKTPGDRMRGVALNLNCAA